MICSQPFSKLDWAHFTNIGMPVVLGILLPSYISSLAQLHLLHFPHPLSDNHLLCAGALEMSQEL